ncbi:uncharacterized protein LOC127079363 [Lathyrus oleraceus]|uniref:uncharacterized protein LOC127079363 n=1 Tax=Pisum sativum TaxID=3888 RepID=UPI0021D0DAC8|nr:uncharacterized protein LOC127079363 [Pisum sativum]
MPVGPQEHSVVQTEILPAVCFGLYTVHCLMRLVTPYIIAPTISAETEAAIFVVRASTIRNCFNLVSTKHSSHTKTAIGIMDKPSSSSPKKKKTRGVTALLRFIAKLPDGEKYQIDFDPDTFQPIGQYAAKFKSYLSFIARSKVSINEKQWKKISDKLKDVIWDDITCKFTCPTDKEFRKHWFVYMGERLKQFKTLLSNVYIFGKGDKHGNTTPFEKYKFIKEEDWDLFVQTRQKEDFQEKRLKGKTHASKNIHPHILSRGGYEKLRATVMEERRKKVIEEAKGIINIITKYEKKVREGPHGHQQDNGWACGYYVMKNMFDIIDACIVERFNEIFTDTSSYEKESIDHIRQLWAQFFLQKVEEQENQEKKDLMTKQKRLKKTYI